MADFSLLSQVRDVLTLGEPGRQLLWKHGYQVGEGFVDVLSQHQSLLEAARAGRLRDADALVEALNSRAGQFEDQGTKIDLPIG